MLRNLYMELFVNGSNGNAASSLPKKVLKVNSTALLFMPVINLRVLTLCSELCDLSQCSEINWSSSKKNVRILVRMFCFSFILVHQRTLQVCNPL